MSRIINTQYTILIGTRLILGLVWFFPRLFSKSIQENLFRGPGDLSDLVSLNIQRGRERGLPSYTTYRNTFCKITPIVNSFEDLQKAGITQKDIDNLKSQYQSVHDVDLFVGGMSAPA